MKKEGNLASNAVKFSSQGGSITVTTSLVRSTGGVTGNATGPAEGRSTPAPLGPQRTSSDDASGGVVTWRVSIQDTGPGIRPSDLAASRLFQPFAQTTVGCEVCASPR